MTHSIKNFGIRKAKKDKVDFLIIAKLGLKPYLKTSITPADLVFEIRTLAPKYYELIDTRVANLNRLKLIYIRSFRNIRLFFQKYRCFVFNDSKTISLMVLTLPSLTPKPNCLFNPWSYFCTLDYFLDSKMYLREK